MSFCGRAKRMDGLSVYLKFESPNMQYQQLEDVIRVHFLSQLSDHFWLRIRFCVTPKPRIKSRLSARRDGSSPRACAIPDQVKTLN